MTKSEREQIAEILERRANEVASFADEYRRDGKHFGSVELALTREINRCPAYVRQAVKMLSKALRDHERASGIIEEPTP